MQKGGMGVKGHYGQGEVSIVAVKSSGDTYEWGRDWWQARLMSINLKERVWMSQGGMGEHSQCRFVSRGDGLGGMWGASAVDSKLVDRGLEKWTLPR